MTSTDWTTDRAHTPNILRGVGPDRVDALAWGAQCICQDCTVCTMQQERVRLEPGRVDEDGVGVRL